ncbi:ionotropic receptor 25a-like [Haliotis rubra]|uniref:ionotropic receptor 25a-like n=1 Tax=Haliotis rubra TaxID=36100 RepID=UPI001EE515DC|nr:ionotropic receptor 25a-like [Haliotis rubra]
MGHTVKHLSDKLSSHGIKAVTYIIDGEMTSNATYGQLLSLYNNTTNNDRNILVMCKLDCFSTLFEQINLHQHLHTAYNHCTANETSVTTSHDMVQQLEKDVDSWLGRIDTLMYRQEGREFSPVGFFDLDGHLTLNVEVFPNTDFGFNMRKLKVGTNVWHPFVILSDTSSSGFGGLCFDLLEEISTLLNFTFEVAIPADKEFGRVLNGSWTGLILELQKRELDLAVAPLSVTVEREAVMDFTFPYYYDQAVGIYTLLCMMEMIWSSLKSDLTAPIGSSYFQESLWYLYGAMLSHGGSQQPRSESGRILVGFWWLFCIVIAASYSGTLIAFLTVNRDILPFSTIADIASQNEYRWGIVGGSSYVTYLEVSV